MKIKYSTLVLSFTLFICATAIGFAQITQLSSDDFNNGFGNWNDGGEDCDLNFYDYGCLTGSDMVRLYDNSGSNSSLFSDAYNLTNYDEVTIHFEYRVASFESNENWYIEFSSDDGNSWSIIKNYIVDEDFIENTCYEEFLSIPSSSHTFNSQNRIRFRSDASDNADYFYIDNILVFGVVPCVIDDITLPWNDGFENNNGTYTSTSSNVGDCWEYQEDNIGRLRFDVVSHTGNKAALFDTSGNSSTQNYLTKTLDLSDYNTATDLELSFWFLDAGDENHDDGDAVWIRGNNASTWIKIYQISPQSFTDRQWYEISGLDIDAVLASNGQSVSSTFQIRLGQYDNYFYASSGTSSDGIAFDDLQITGTNCLAPTTFNVTGDDLTTCSGSSETTAIGLDGSESGVTYQLLRDGSDVGAAISGSGLGSAIDFGDFNTAGTYTVEATRTDGGCTQTMAGNVIVTVTAIVDASFNTTATSIEVGESITFTDTSDGSPTSWSWDFNGDGSADATTQNPTHTFNTAGTFTVTLTATNSCGSDTATTTITVSVAPEDLFYEDFSTEQNNSTSGTDLYGTTWDSDDSQGNPDFFGVFDDSDFIDAVFWAEDTDGPVYWYTDNINISDYENLNLRSFVEFYEIDNDGDYIKFYYKLDGDDLQEIETFTGDYTDTYYDWNLTGVTGDNLQIWVEFNSDDDDDYYGIGNIKLTGTIDCDAVDNNVTNASATTDDSQAALSWSNPNATCVSIDQVLVVAKQGSAVTTSPSGDGSDYTASEAFGYGSAFDGGFVVYKGSAETVTVTSLVNFVTYHGTLFTRSGTTWSSGETVLITPSVSEVLFYEDFSDDTSSGSANDFSGTDEISNIPWTADEQGSADKWEISGGKWKGKKVYTESSFTTNPFSITGYLDLQFQFYIEFKDLENSNNEWVKVFYTIDDGTEQLLEEYLGDNTDQIYTVDLPSDAVGDDIILRIEMHHDDSDEHKIDNIKLIGSPFYNVWQGLQSDLVTTNSNWSKESVPTATSNVLVPSTKHLTLVDDRAFNAINIRSTASLTIEKTGSLTTIGDFTKIAGTGAVTLNSDSTNFASIIVEGTATGDITYNRWVNETGPFNGNDWDFVGSPVKNQSISGFISANSGVLPTSGDLYGIAKYYNEWDSWEWYTTTNIGNDKFNTGEAYYTSTIVTNEASGATLAFTGEIPTGTQEKEIINNNGTNTIGRRWEMVANPYASYIHGNPASGDENNNFVKVNLDLNLLAPSFGGIYAWNGTGGYTIYNLAQINTATIAPGQGFWIAARQDTPQQLQFTPAMQTVNGGDDFISGAPILLNYMLNLKLYQGTTEKAKTSFYFQQGLTDSLDTGYDAGALEQTKAISSRLIENDIGYNMSINAMSIETAYNQTIPLVINQQEGQNFRVSISENTLPEDINVYLEDTQNETLTSLKNQDFELVAQEDLSQDGRFYIRFTTESLAINDVLSSSSITVFKLNTDNFITIKGLSPEMGKTNATLYNMLGMKVREKALDSSQSAQQIATQGLASGVYIINLKAGEQAVSKKVIIQ